MSTGVSAGDLVLLAGRYGDLTNSSKNYQGEIAPAQSQYLSIVSLSTRIGKIGVPVIHDGKVAGLVINDQGSLINALSISTIQNILYHFLSITPERRVLRLPYATVGLKVGLNFPISQLANVMVATETGAFLETGLSRTIVLRIGYSQNYFKSREFRTFEDIFEFRNKFNAYSITLQYIESATYYSQIFSGYGQTFSRIYFEYFYLRHNPQVKSGGIWKDLRDHTQFDHDYQTKSHGFTIGGNTNLLIDRHLVLGFEFGFQYTLTSYLHINPLEPFAQQSGNDWLLFLKLYTGFTIGNSKPQIQYLAN